MPRATVEPAKEPEPESWRDEEGYVADCVDCVEDENHCDELEKLGGDDIKVFTRDVDCMPVALGTEVAPKEKGKSDDSFFDDVSCDESQEELPGSLDTGVASVPGVSTVASAGDPGSWREDWGEFWHGLKHEGLCRSFILRFRKLLRPRIREDEERRAVRLLSGRGRTPGTPIVTSGSDCANVGERAAPEDTAGVASDSWLILDRSGVAVPEEGEYVTTRSVESKVEQLLTWMLTPAVHGIPNLGVPSAADRAEELLVEHRRQVEVAAREVVAGSERTVSNLVSNFCLERIPVLGCPTVLLRTTWGNLRSVLIIAALYGHDLENPRVQHEALFCLVPSGQEANSRRPAWRGDGRGKAQQAQLLRDTTQRVARMMIKGAVHRAIGIRAAVDCIELASLLYNSCGKDTAEEDEDGFVHVLSTPASAALELFRRKSFASSALLWCSLPLLALGVLAPAFFHAMRWVPAVVEMARVVKRWLPKPLRETSFPALLLACLGVVLALATAFRLLDVGMRGRGRRRGLANWFRMRLFPRQPPDSSSRSSLRLNVPWPQVLATVVFAVHAVLPAISTYSAVYVMLGSARATEGRLDDVDPNGWDGLHRIASFALGLYSLCAVVSRHVQNEWPPPEAWNATRSMELLARWALRFLGTAEAIARAACVLIAWAYASLLFDLVATRIARGVGQLLPDSPGSALGVNAPMAWAFGAVGGTNPLESAKAVTFTLQLISIVSQRQLVELLGRREVILRLIGAERVTAQTLVLLMKGVGVALDGPWTGTSPIAEFLTRVSPPPICCVLLVALRSQAILLGAMFVLAPWLTLTNALDSAVSFTLGILAGTYATQVVLSVWYTNRSDLDSPALRLALLVPGGVSGRAKVLLRDALQGARTKAVQMMAMGIFARVMRWLFRPSR
jgi:hypothetical protein